MADAGPEVPEYKWEPWPDGLFTARQLSDERLQPGPVRGKIWMAKHGKWLLLYRKDEATSKPERTPAQEAAAAKTAEALRTGWTCSECGSSLSYYTKGGGFCRDCQREGERKGMRKVHRASIAESTYDLLHDPAGFVIVDTETTGLEGDVRVCQIAVVDKAGAVLLDTLMQPGIPIPADATAIHGITDAMVADAPTWSDVEPRLRAALTGRRVLIYNAEYDAFALANTMVQAGVRPGIGLWDHLGADGQPQCVMEAYAVFVGEWSSYHGNYRWQKLPDANVNAPAHSALGDCLRTLHVLREMARWHEERAAQTTEA